MDVTVGVMNRENTSARVCGIDMLNSVFRLMELENGRFELARAVAWDVTHHLCERTRMLRDTGVQVVSG